MRPLADGELRFVHSSLVSSADHSGPFLFERYQTMKTTLTRSAIRFVAKTFAKDEDGATAIEYGLFAALIGAAIVGTVATLGGQTNAGFSDISSKLTSEGISEPAG